MYNEVKCRGCGKRLLTYEQTGYKYGSPLKVCKKCQTEYLDPRFVEPAVSGFSAKETIVLSYSIILVVGVLLAMRGIHMYSMRMLNMADEFQWLMPTLILAAGIALILGGSVEIIMIMTGAKQKKLDHLLTESENRLRDVNYAAKLSKLGYPIPKNYLNGEQ